MSSQVFTSFTINHADNLPRSVIRILAGIIVVAHALLIFCIMKYSPVYLQATGTGTVFVSIFAGESASDKQKATPVAQPAEKTNPVKKTIERAKAPSPKAASPKAPAPAKTETRSNLLASTDTVETKTEFVAERPKKDVTEAQDKTATSQEKEKPFEYSPDRDHSPVASDKAESQDSGKTGSQSANAPGSAGQSQNLASGDTSGLPRTVSLSQLTYKNAEKPEYPEKSIERYESGQVSVRVVVGKDGKVKEAGIRQTSGFARLDNAALRAAKRTTFYPYTENGVPQVAVAIIPYNFNLKTQ